MLRVSTSASIWRSTIPMFAVQPRMQVRAMSSALLGSTSHPRPTSGRTRPTAASSSWRSFWWSSSSTAASASPFAGSGQASYETFDFLPYVRSSSPTFFFLVFKLELTREYSRSFPTFFPSSLPYYSHRAKMTKIHKSPLNRQLLPSHRGHTQSKAYLTKVLVHLRLATLLEARSSFPNDRSSFGPRSSLRVRRMHRSIRSLQALGSCISAWRTLLTLVQTWTRR